ncbi:hypothetical protein FOA52_000661 [Chlamydomonas sp. UWO 241]|nr:hypothetical protein FOA52_000661 [Chlamydomonas sp. UWO 241]
MAAGWLVAVLSLGLLLLDSAYAVGFASSLQVGACDLSLPGLPTGCLLQELQDTVTLATNTTVYINFSSVTGTYTRTTYGDWNATLTGTGAGKVFWMFGTCPTLANASTCATGYYDAQGIINATGVATACATCYVQTVATQDFNPIYIDSSPAPFPIVRSVAITGNIPNYIASGSWARDQSSPALTEFVVFMASKSDMSIGVTLKMQSVTTSQSIPPSPPPPSPPLPPSPLPPPPSPPKSDILPIALGVGLGVGLTALLALLALLLFFFFAKKKHEKVGPMTHDGGQVKPAAGDGSQSQADIQPPPGAAWGSLGQQPPEATRGSQPKSSQWQPAPALGANEESHV